MESRERGVFMRPPHPVGAERATLRSRIGHPQQTSAIESSALSRQKSGRARFYKVIRPIYGVFIAARRETRDGVTAHARWKSVRMNPIPCSRRRFVPFSSAGGFTMAGNQCAERYWAPPRCDGLWPGLNASLRKHNSSPFPFLVKHSLFACYCQVGWLKIKFAGIGVSFFFAVLGTGVCVHWSPLFPRSHPPSSPPSSPSSLCTQDSSWEPTYSPTGRAKLPSSLSASYKDKESSPHPPPQQTSPPNLRTPYLQGGGKAEEQLIWEKDKD